MSTDDPPFVVAVELTNEYVTENGTFVDWLGQKNRGTYSPERLTFRFRAPQPINGVEVLAPGCTLRDDAHDPSNDASLQPLTNKLLDRLRGRNTRRDEPDDNVYDDEPTQEDLNADAAEQYHHDQPKITAAWSGTEGQDNPSAAAQTPLEASDKPRIIWLDNVFDELPPIDWVCEKLQLFRGGRPFLMAAYGGTGKTMALQSMIIAMAAGLPIWGNDDLRIPRPLNVGHCDLDQGPYATKRRTQRLALGMGVPFEDIKQRIHIASLVRLPLTDPNAKKEYCRAFEGLDFVFLDPLRGLTTGIDENDSRMKDFLDMLTDISVSSKTAIGVIHHQGKPKQHDNGDGRHAVRGSSGIFDGCGSVFTLEGGPDEPAKKLLHVKSAAESTGSKLEKSYLIIEDVKIGSNPFAGVRVVHRTAEHQDATSPGKSKKPLDDLMRQVFAFVKDHPKCSVRAMKAALKGAHDAKLGARDELVRLGYVHVKKGVKRSEPDELSATAAGLHWLAGNSPPTVGRDDAPPIVPHDEPATLDTAANPNDAPKDA